MAKDPRYHELLGLDPDIETPPNAFELLTVEVGTSDEEVINANFKTQMKKLQQIKSSKHKGFIEMLKEDLRTAKRKLTNDKLREAEVATIEEREKQRREQEQAQKIEPFRIQVRTFLQLGAISKQIYDTLIQVGSGLGLEEELCRTTISDMAREAGVEVQTEAPPPEPEPPAEPPAPTSAPAGSTAARRPRPQPRGVSDRMRPPVAPPMSGPAPVSAVRRPVAPRQDSAPSSGFPRSGASDRLMPPERPNIQRGGRSFYDTGGALDSGGAPSPAIPPPVAPRFDSGGFQRGGRSFYGSGGSLDPSGPAGAASRSASAEVPALDLSASSVNDRATRDPGYLAKLREVIDIYNRAVKSVKLGYKAHKELEFYFPPRNRRDYITSSLSGVTYERLFEIEMKLYREAQRLFDDAKRKARDYQLREGLPEDFSDRVERGLQRMKGYQQSCRELKMNRMRGLSKQEELRLWNDYLREPRAPEHARALDVAE